jgi:uncharacterized membrane-anchored protein YhcB (DUF1043 family)
LEILVVIGIFAVIGFIGWLQEELSEKESTKKELDTLKSEVNTFKQNLDQIKQQKQDLEICKTELEQRKEDLDELVNQRTQGFPLLAEVYGDYLDMKDRIEIDQLRFKKRPALKAAEAIKASNEEKRELLQKSKILEYKIKNYELIAPFLTEVEEGPTEQDKWLLQDYSEEERRDETTYYLKKEEYRKLSVTERNQLALDRYWDVKKKSNWAIGKMYEHYVGYVYESKGWDVYYYGIEKRMDDLGRDLIATKGNERHIIQCKHWSKFKKIYENHIFQLFGTAFEFSQKYPELKIVPVFYTSTRLSDTALEMARRLEVVMKQEFKMEKYPAIKCNVNKENNTKIYHLPFDQQYDKTKIKPEEGDFYCMTVKEAEAKGFRRAFRWRGEKPPIR